jgi:hypothetical protein
MSEKDTNTELLIQYMDGELEGSALAEVESKILNDPALQQELENIRATQLAVRSFGLRQRIGNIHAEMMPDFKTTQTTKAPVRRMFKNVFSVAASIIIVIGLVSAYEYYTLTSRSLFEANYTSYVMHEVRGDQHSSALEQLYKQNLMQQVIKEFVQIKQPSVQDYFYVGQAYLEEHNALQATNSFKLLQQKNFTDNTHLLEDDAEYYLAVSYLQNNEPHKALPLFNKIHNDKQHLYHDKVSAWFLFKLKLVDNK